MTDRPDSGAAIEQEPQSGAPENGSSDDDFWRLAKKGLAAWGHEPTTEEIVDYWQGLIDEERREAAAAADPLGPVVEDPVTVLTALADLARPLDDLPDAGITLLTSLLDLRRAEPPATEDSIATLTALLDLRRPAPPPAPVEDTRPVVVTAEAVGWLAVAPTAMAAPMVVGRNRTWWRVAAARPAAVPAPSARPEPVAGRMGRVGLGLGGGGLAYADCLGVLDRRRRAQQGRRQWGRHIALPVAPLDAYERELRHGADMAAAEYLEAALRAAVAGAGGLPPVRWVEAAAAQVIVALDEPAPAPPGFLDVAGPPGTCLWTTSGDRRRLDEAADRALPPLPLLAPLGRTTAGHERLVDLEAWGVTTVDGAPDDVLGLLRATVVAMATASWCTPLRIVAVGLGRELTALPGVDVVDSLDVALTYAEAHVHQVAAALAGLGEPEPSVGRVRAQGLSTAASGALLVVSAQLPGDPAVGQRMAALAERRSAGIGVLLRHPSSPEVVLSGCSPLRIRDDGALHDDAGGPSGEPVWARRLDATDARRLVELLAVADRRDDGHAAVRPRRAHQADDEGPDLVVRVLGEVEVDGIDAGGTAVEALAYLALREASVTHAALEAALFPDGAPSVHAVERCVTAAGELACPGVVQRPTPGRYAVSERVATDYGLLCDLVARSDDAVAADDLAAAADHLTAALELVRATPLDGAGRGYAWAGPAREAIVAQVVDAADSLACLAARAEDWPAVDRAAIQGLRAAPASERLHRWRMRAAHAAGDIDRVHELFETACDLVADPALGVEPDDTLQPETIQLLEALVSRRPATESVAPPADPATPGVSDQPGEIRRLAPDRPLPITEELPEVAATRPPDALIA